jgi:hypothetical protein
VVQRHDAAKRFFDAAYPCSGIMQAD